MVEEECITETELNDDGVMDFIASGYIVLEGLRTTLISVISPVAMPTALSAGRTLRRVLLHPQ